MFRPANVSFFFISTIFLHEIFQLSICIQSNTQKWNEVSILTWRKQNVSHMSGKYVFPQLIAWAFNTQNQLGPRAFRIRRLFAAGLLIYFLLFFFCSSAPHVLQLKACDTIILFYFYHSYVSFMSHWCPFSSMCLNASQCSRPDVKLAHCESFPLTLQFSVKIRLAGHLRFCTPSFLPLSSSLIFKENGNAAHLLWLTVYL